MPTIERCVDKIVPVAPGDDGAHVLTRFQAEPDALGLAVVEGGRVLGLIERDAFLLNAAGPFGGALCLSRRAADLMDAEAVVVDANLAIETLGPSLLAGGAGSLRRAFVVTRAGAYYGVGSGVSLIQASNQRLAESLTQMGESRAARDDAARDKSRFLGLVGRELRNPLNGVGAVAELLARQPLPAEAQSHVQTIADSAAATLRLLEDAIDLARAEAGELAVTPAPTGLQPLIDRLQTEWQARARQADVTLMLGYEGDTELAAEIDGDRLTQIIDNLVANAVSRSRHGVVEASLKAVAEDQSIRIAVTVRDDSADADRPDLDPAAPDDAGLAVAISRHLVADLGGVLSASANQGRGAAFSFALTAPRAQIAAEPAGNVSELATLQIEQAPHVLIVDDNATNRVVAQALCEMFGCTCETAEDGVEAVEAVLNRPFDMVLMDIKMPRMDGVAATAAIRALAGDAGATPIVALTANADPDDAARYLEAGMCGVVEKPIKPERLRLAMNTALSQPRGQVAPAASSASPASRVA